jgi:hypothetical protein
VRIKAGNSKGYSDNYSPDASVPVSGIPIVIGSWKGDQYTYTFEENGKLIRTSLSSGSTRYWFYDFTTKEFYEGTNSQYALSGNSLTFPAYPFNGTWTADAGNEGLIGTWNKDGNTTMEITADTITIGSATYLYYTYSEGSTLVYKLAAAEPAGRYAFSGGKLRVTSFTSTSQLEGTGNGIVGTWKNNQETWTFTDKTAKRTDSDGSETNYTYKKLSSSKISMEQEVGTLSGNTLTLAGSDFSRTDGSGIIGSWSGSLNGQPITVTITQDKLKFTQIVDGQSYPAGSFSIRIEGNKIYGLTEYSYKLDGDTLTLIGEYTEECSPATK